MKRIFLIIYSFLFLFIYTSQLGVVLAADFNPNGSFGSCTAPLRDASGKTVNVPVLSCVFPLIADGISWLLEFSGAVAVILIIVAGIRIITANGDPKTIAEGKKIFEFAIIGLVIVFMSFFIVRFIAQTTGVSCIDPRRPLSFTVCQ